MNALATLLWAAAVIAWIADFPRKDYPLAFAQSVITGLTAGIFLGAWT